MMQVLDAKGLVCPLPVLKARKVLLAMPAGGVLKVSVTDAAAPRDFGLFCNENGYTLISVEATGQGFDITVKKS